MQKLDLPESHLGEKLFDTASVCLRAWWVYRSQTAANSNKYSTGSHATSYNTAVRQ